MFWLRVSCEVTVFRCQPALRSPEGLTGAGKSDFKIADTLDWQVFAGYPAEVSVLYVAFSVVLLECPYNMAAEFSESTGSKREQDRNHSVFMT